MAMPKALLEQQPQAPPRFTAAEYLEQERAAEARHEFLDGEVYAMAGESPQHADISANLVGELIAQLKGKPCRVRTKDTKVRSGPLPFSPRKQKGLFSYPDAVVICGTPEYLDAYQDVVTNPTVIFELLSPSTAFHDRHLKFQKYDKWSPTLSDYVLIWQDIPFVEHYQRQEDGSWLYRNYEGLEQLVPLENISCTLDLAALYDRVEFPPEEAELEESEEEVAADREALDEDAAAATVTE
jgi:Uma2 family endonuclease